MSNGVDKVDKTLITSYKDTLSKSEVKDAELSALFNQTLAGVAYISADGTFMRVNTKFCEIVGYSTVELCGRKTFHDITHPDDVEIDNEEAKSIIAGEKNTYRLQKRYLHKQGYSVWVDLYVSAVRDSSGTFVHMIKVEQELRIPGSSIQVSMDDKGQPFLQPVVSVKEFIVKNKVFFTTIVLPFLLTVVGGAGATIRTYYNTAAELEAGRMVMTDQRTTITDQKKEIQALREEVRDLSKSIKSMVK